MAYSWYRAITLNHVDVVESDQVNFPVMLTAPGTTLTNAFYSWLKTVANGGKLETGVDFVFSLDPFGTQLLPYEVVFHDFVTGAFEYWVSVPLLSMTVDTVIYVIYGDPSVTTDQSNRSAVWDSGFLGVYHFGR